MTEAEKLAGFIARVTPDDLPDTAQLHLKIRVLDALGCAMGALGGSVATQLRTHTEEFGYHGRCTLSGGGRSAPDRAAFFNSALVRYLDFNDSYLAKGTCHSSDNLAAVLGACEYAGRSGRDFLMAPVRAKGFDHTTQGSYAVTAGVPKGLSLDEKRAVNALAICGTAFNALRVTRSTQSGTLREPKSGTLPTFLDKSRLRRSTAGKE